MTSNKMGNATPAKHPVLNCTCERPVQFDRSVHHLNACDIVEMSKKCKTNIGNKYIPLYITLAVACVFVVLFSFVLVVTDSFLIEGGVEGK